MPSTPSPLTRCRLDAHLNRHRDGRGSVQQISPSAEHRLHQGRGDPRNQLGRFHPSGKHGSKRVQMLDLVVEGPPWHRPTATQPGNEERRLPQPQPGSARCQEASTHQRGATRRVRRALLLMSYTGLRIVRAIALRWERVDLTTGRLVIAENTPSAGSAGAPTAATRLTFSLEVAHRGAPRRDVPILKPLRPHIAGWVKEDGNPACGLVCTTTTGTAIPGEAVIYRREWINQ